MRGRGMRKVSVSVIVFMLVFSTFATFLPKAMGSQDLTTGRSRGPTIPLVAPIGMSNLSKNNASPLMVQLDSKDFVRTLLSSSVVADPPGGNYMHSYDTSHGNFRVHYNSSEPGSTDIGNGVLNSYAQEVGEAFEDAVNFETNAPYNYPFPTIAQYLTDDYPSIAIYIHDLSGHGQGVAGLTQTWSDLGSCLAYFEIDANLGVFDNMNIGYPLWAINSTAYHEFFHGIQTCYTNVLDPLVVPVEEWIVEGTAAWMENEGAYHGKNGNMQYPSATTQARAKEVLDRPEDSLTRGSYNASLYWAYLAQRFGTNAVKEVLGAFGIWSTPELKAVLIASQCTLAVDAALLTHGSTFDSSMIEFAEKLYSGKDWFTYKELFSSGLHVQPYTFTGNTITYTQEQGRSVERYASGYAEVTPNIDSMLISFSGNWLTAFAVQVLTIKNSVIQVNSMTLDLTKNGYLYVIGTYDKVVIIVTRVNDLLGDGTYTVTLSSLSDFYITAVSDESWYRQGEVTKTTVTVTNTRDTRTTFWIGVSFRDPTGESQKYDYQITWTPKSGILDPGKSTTFSVSWTVPADAPTGRYQIAVNCWKGTPFTPPSYTDNLEWAAIFYVYKFRILTPTGSSPAQAGPPSNPNQIAVLTEWIPPTLLDPSGTKKPTFTIKVGGKGGTYVLVNNPGAEALGKYTLNVSPSTQAADGLYDLYVQASFDSTTDSDTQNNAVKYATGGGGGGAKIAYISFYGDTMTDEVNYLHSLDPQKYNFDWYYESNIGNLWPNLNDYKAILVDEDVFYGSQVEQSFKAHPSELAAFVNNGGGVFTSGENDALTYLAWDWLPPGMRVTSYDPERTSNVHIVYDPGAPNGLYSYPNTITDSYLSGGHTHAWFSSWDKGYLETVRRTDNGQPIELCGFFGKGCIVVSHVEAEYRMYGAWQYMQNQLDFIVPPSEYKMVVTSPSVESIFGVTSIITFEAMIIDTDGNPGTGATVSVNLPDGTIMALNEALPNSGVYRATYEIAPTDPTGPWPIAFLSSIGGEFPKITVPVLIQTDTTPPSITVLTPSETSAPEALQDGATLAATVTDQSGVSWVTFFIRETDGTTIDPSFESMSAAHSTGDTWQLLFNTYVPKLPDGYYLLIVEASDTFGNQGSKTVLFSIRNWAHLKLLPATLSNNAGRTMPIKFSLRVYENVDPAKPFVYNEQLTIKIYEKSNPSRILQTSIYGAGSTNYRIDSVAGLYITNFKTSKIPTTYTVEIWRKELLIGAFDFKTVKQSTQALLHFSL
jgi:hypothetical protein